MQLRFRSEEAACSLAEESRFGAQATVSPDPPVTRDPVTRDPVTGNPTVHDVDPDLVSRAHAGDSLRRSKHVPRGCCPRLRIPVGTPGFSALRSPRCVPRAL